MTSIYSISTQMQFPVFQECEVRLVKRESSSRHVKQMMSFSVKYIYFIVYHLLVIHFLPQIFTKFLPSVSIACSSN